MRLIDADALMLRIDMHGTNKFGMLDKDIREFITEQPTIDAVPVVRCKDCLYYTVGKNICESWEWCNIHQRDTGPYEYCSYGEHKDKT